MKNIIGFDNRVEVSERGNKNTFTFILDLENKEVRYNKTCSDFLYEVRKAIEMIGKSRVVPFPYAEGYETFIAMLKNTIGLEECGIVSGIPFYKVPEELTVERFEKAIVFSGVVEYFVEMDDGVLPESITEDDEVLAYFRNCSFCTGNVYRDEHGNKVFKSEVYDLVKYFKQRGIDLKYCPVCGKKF